MGKKSSTSPGLPNYGSSQPAGPQTNWRPPAANGWGSPMRYAPRQAPVPQAPVPQAQIAQPVAQPAQQEAPQPMAQSVPQPQAQAQTMETSLAPPAAPAGVTPAAPQAVPQELKTALSHPGLARALRGNFGGNR